MTLALSTLHNLLAGRAGIVDVACPECGPHCKAPSNITRKVLRIWCDGSGLVTYVCARCEAKGWATERARGDIPSRPSTPAPQAAPAPDRAETARALWDRSLPLPCSLAETYLIARRCAVDSDALRFLPSRGDYHPAMIARFGSGPVTGVHLTRLRPDGSGKAGTEQDKLTLGPSMGQPIIVADNPDRGELVIAEGIEDAASLALATGWTAWAAGTAGRIGPVVAAAGGYDRVYLAVDDDAAGRRALAAAQAVREVVPVRFARVLPAADANAAMQAFGMEAVTAVVDWCDTAHRLARGEIGFAAAERSYRAAEAAIPTTRTAA